MLKAEDRVPIGFLLLSGSPLTACQVLSFFEVQTDRTKRKEHGEDSREHRAAFSPLHWQKRVGEFALVPEKETGTEAEQGLTVREGLSMAAETTRYRTTMLQQHQ